MKVLVQGRGAVTLTDRDFIVAGGEGRLYGKGNIAYKLYTDPRRMIPPAKIDELRVLDRPNIIRPLDLLYDAHGRPMGFTMPRVTGAVALPRLFTNDYRDRHRVSAATTESLVSELRRTIEFIHRHDILMVDGNEFNYLVDDRRHLLPYVVDVGSFQTPSFPATAIMASIRDWTAEGFSRMTDWFSFAVVACQLFVGIHPFKGRHADFRPGDFEGRVKAGVSIFNKEVRVPSSARDPGQIPANYRRWFLALFERGERTPPPAQSGAIAASVPQRLIFSSDALEVKEVRSYGQRVFGARTVNGTLLARTRSDLYVGGTRYALRGSETVILNDANQPIAFSVEDGRLVARMLGSGEALASELKAERVLRTGNRVYALSNDNLLEIEVLELADRSTLVAGNRWKILPNAVRAFDGVLLEDVLGNTHAVIPFRQGATAVLALSELDPYRVVAARYEERVLVVSGATREGRYDQWLFRFNEAHDRYDARVTEDTDAPINFAVLDSGVVVRTIEDGRLEAFANQPGSELVRVVEDPQIGLAMPLFNHAGRAAVFAYNKVFQLHNR